MRKTLFGLAIAACLIAGGALAQQSVQQSGGWVQGHVPTYVGTSTNPAVIDSGLTPGSPLVTIVASLPTCQSSNKGQLYVVTDASSPTYNGTLTGGSTTTALALCNGSTWAAH